MIEYEKLGFFYLGRKYDLENNKPIDELILYDSKDLLTHGVCIGMTGSGKTGLCIGILEEAAIDNIPSIAIDPKGDLTNIALLFENLTPEEFLPWINEEEATKKGLTKEEYAKEISKKWEEGINEWGQTKERIKKLKENVDFIIYTPGSNAGVPISILKSFSSPPKEILEDEELLSDKIISTTTSLLGLIGIEGDPLRSKEHILVSKIIELYWRQGKNINLETLIQEIQKPSIEKIGVMSIETFYPSNERHALSIAINNLIASPQFNLWFEGVPLDVGKLLYSKEGKPRVSIFYIAHLNEKERMFFVSLLFNEILSWVRTLSGTQSLRAIVYMDEIFGYFPPIANPPSKKPLLTLLKQARAFGVGILLSTQNPVDLDYKGLSNTGTWFIGRLQTERDKEKVLEGLDTVSQNINLKFDRKFFDKAISSLGKRVFIMNNIHENEPVIFETRHVLSYLRGPLTKDHIKILMENKKDFIIKKQVEEKAPIFQEKLVYPTEETKKETPIIPPSISQFFAKVREAKPQDSVIFYKPFVIGSSMVNFSDSKKGIDYTVEKIIAAEIKDKPIPVDWSESFEIKIDLNNLSQKPEIDSIFDKLPQQALIPKNYDSWKRELINHIKNNITLEIFRSPTYKVFSKPNESEEEFKIKLIELSREKRDEEKEKIIKKYETKLSAMEEKYRKALQMLDREKDQLQQRKLQTTISVGATILGAILGRKVTGVGNVGRATTAARDAGRIMKEQEDIKRAEETVQKYESELKELEREFQEEIKKFEEKSDPTKEIIERIILKPSKTEINIRFFSLVWLPFFKSGDTLTPAF
ncbi:MAG: ATP-binding protein [Caldisericia bacterium]|nr:ATP-binding protein [Caldisericia bacterium]